MAYTQHQVAMAAQTQADRHKAKADTLTAAIATHYNEVHKGNWGGDDELWASIGLVADPDVVG
jgi:hypothetical protein